MESVSQSVSQSVRPRNRVLLSLFVPLALVSIAAAARAPEGRTPNLPLSYVTVRADSDLSRATANPPLVQGVRYLLRNAFDTRKPGSSNALSVRSTLEPVFGTALKETGRDVVYFWWWSGTGWVWVCSKLTRFELEIPGLGRAIVETVDAQL